jgi:hypothetical protein
MSQPELFRELRAARPVAPVELRERVRLVAAQASPPGRRAVTRRRALVVALPVAAAVAVAAGVIVSRPAHHSAQPPTPLVEHAATDVAGASAKSRALVPAQVPTSGKRLQRYTASLQLRVQTTAAVSRAAKLAVAIAAGLGGYVASVNVNASGRSGYADIRLRIPKPHVQDAVRRLSALGQIVGENVQVQDLQAGVNATDRLIARLQHDLALLRAQTQTRPVQRRIVALTARIQQLQRNRAATARTAHYATVELNVTTPQAAPPKPRHHGPLHGLVSAFRWIGIGIVYALAVGVPFVLLALAVWLVVRAVRRRREDALLNDA